MLARGLRLLLIAIALVGFVAGRGFVAVPAHAAMAVEATAVHDCCDKASSGSAERTGPAGECQDIACPMTAPAVSPDGPALAFLPVRPVFAMAAAHPLDGRALPPPLEPPRA